MHTKKKRELNLNLKEYPTDHALKALKEEYYFEAVAVLHGFIEREMKSFFHLKAATISNTPLKNAWDVNEKLSYIMLAHSLFILNFIGKNEYDTLVSFNTIRNEIMHRYYLDKYEEGHIGISKVKLNSCFKSALKVVKEIGKRADELV
jgi:hypothetical protein